MAYLETGELRSVPIKLFLWKPCTTRRRVSQDLCLSNFSLETVAHYETGESRSGMIYSPFTKQKTLNNGGLKLTSGVLRCKQGPRRVNYHVWTSEPTTFWRNIYGRRGPNISTTLLALSHYIYG